MAGQFIVPGVLVIDQSFLLRGRKAGPGRSLAFIEYSENQDSFFIQPKTKQASALLHASSVAFEIDGRIQPVPELPFKVKRGRGARRKR